jgi:TRAP-type C4-dicarboxylate transport system permease small subunit
VPSQEIKRKNPFDIVISKICSLFNYGATIPLLFMSMLLCIDVVRRYFFYKAISGSMDLVELCMATIVFLALGATTKENEHITVKLIAEKYKGKIKQTTEYISFGLCVLIGSLITWQMGQRAYSELLHPRYVTNTISIPIGIFLLIGALGWFVSVLAFLIKIKGKKDTK